MTVALSGKETATRIAEKFPGSVIESTEASLVVKTDSLLAIAAFLKDTPGLNFNFLSGVTSVDYGEYFEVVYNLTSFDHNHSLVLKTRCYGRDNPSVPSVVSLWKGADLQEREIYDLMGIKFEGHPNLKRIALWEGYVGHPLRKDFWQWPS